MSRPRSDSKVSRLVSQILRKKKTDDKDDGGSIPDLSQIESPEIIELGPVTLTNLFDLIASLQLEDLEYGIELAPKVSASPRSHYASPTSSGGGFFTTFATPIRKRKDKRKAEDATSTIWDLKLEEEQRWQLKYSLNSGHVVSKIDLHFEMNRTRVYPGSHNISVSILRKLKGEKEEWETLYDHFDLTPTLVNSSQATISLDTNIYSGSTLEIRLHSVLLNRSRSSSTGINLMDNGKQEVEDPKREESPKPELLKSTSEPSSVAALVKQDTSQSLIPSSNYDLAISFQLYQTTSKKGNRKRETLFRSENFHRMLLKTCEDVTSSLPLRVASLTLLTALILNDSSVSIRETVTKTTDLASLLDATIIRGDYNTSELCLLMLTRLAEKSGEFKAILGQKCLEIFPKFIEECMSYAGMRVFLGLVNYVQPPKMSAHFMEALQTIAKRVMSSRSPYNAILRTHFSSLEGYPLEQDIFEIKEDPILPVLPSLERISKCPSIKDKKFGAVPTIVQDVLTVSLKKVQKGETSVTLDYGEIIVFLGTYLTIDLGYPGVAAQIEYSIEAYSLQPDVVIQLKKESTSYPGIMNVKILFPSPVMCRFLKITFRVNFDPPRSCLRMTNYGWSDIRSKEVRQSVENNLASQTAALVENKTNLCTYLEAFQQEAKDQGMVTRTFHLCLEQQYTRHVLKSTENLVNAFHLNELPTPQYDFALGRYFTIAKAISDIQLQKTEKSPMKWKRANILFQSFCILGQSDVRQKLGALISVSLRSNSLWVTPLLQEYFSSQNNLHGSFPTKETFELLFTMIKPDTYQSVSGQLFTLLESQVSQPSVSQDIALISWTLLLLSKILTQTTQGALVVHPGSRCGFCGVWNITGVRYHCSNCPNFDLCEVCEQNSSEIHDPDHIFMKIPKPLPLPPSGTKPSGKWENKPLMPVLYAPQPKKNPSKKKKNKKAKIHQHDVTCAGCGVNPIVGPRYKCCNCQDFDLCDKCQATVSHFPTHVFLKVLRPIQNSNEGTEIPKALVSNQSLIPMILHRSLYPAGASPKTPRMSRMNRADSKAKSSLLGQSLQLDLMEDTLSEDENVQQVESTTSSLVTIFNCLANLSTEGNSQEPLLLAMLVMGLVVRQYTFEDVRQNVLENPRFGQYLEGIVSTPNPFIHSSILELFDTILDASTYASTHDSKNSLTSLISQATRDMKVRVSSLLTQSQTGHSIDLLIDLLDILIKKSQTTAKRTESKPTSESQWKTVSAPIVIDEEDTIWTDFPLDDKTADLLLKFLSQKPLDNSTVWYWYTCLSMFKNSDGHYLIQSKHFWKMIEVALSSSNDIQVVLQDSFQGLISWLASLPNTADLEQQLFEKLIDGLAAVQTGAIEAVTLFKCIINSFDTKPEILQKSENVENLLNALGNFLRGGGYMIEQKGLMNLVNLSERAVEIHADRLSPPVKDIKSTWSSFLLSFLFHQKVQEKSPGNAGPLAPSLSEKVKSIILILAKSQEWCRHFLQVALNQLKDRPTPSTLQLISELIKNEHLASYFLVELGGWSVLQIMLKQNRGKSPLFPELGAIAKMTKTDALAPTKSSQGGLWEFGPICELVSPNDLQLRNVLNDVMGNTGAVWTVKPPSGNMEHETSITLKLKDYIMLKSVVITTTKSWYLDSTLNGLSDHPTFMTVAVGRTASQMKPLARIPWEALSPKTDAHTVNLRTLTFPLPYGTVCKVIVIKLKHYGDQPLALNKLLLRGYTGEHFGDVEENSPIWIQSSELVAECLAFPSVCEHIGSSRENVQALAYSLITHLGENNSHVQDIIFFLAKSNPTLSLDLEQHLLNGESMTVHQTELVGRLCGIQDEFSEKKIGIFKKYLWKLLENPQAVFGSLSVMNAFCNALYQQKENSLKFTAAEVLLLLSYSIDSPEGSKMEDSCLRLLSIIVQLNIDSFKDILQHITKDNDILKLLNSGKSLPILAILTSASEECGKTLLNSPILSAVAGKFPELLKTRDINYDRMLHFLALIFHSHVIRDWGASQIIPMLLDSWESISSHVTLSNLYMQIFDICSNCHRETQETLGKFLVSQLRASTSAGKVPPEPAVKLMHSLVSHKHSQAVCLHHLHNRIEDTLGGTISNPNIKLKFDKHPPSVLINDNVAEETGSAYLWVTCMASTPMSRGVHTWDVEVNTCHGNLTVGLCESEHSLNVYLGMNDYTNGTSKAGFGLMCSGYFYHSAEDASHNYFGNSFTSGDTISVELDFDLGKIVFTKAGVVLTTYLGKLQGRTFYPAVSFNGPGEKASLVNYKVTGQRVAATKMLEYPLPQNSPLKFHRVENVFWIPTSTILVDVERRLAEGIDPANPREISLRLQIEGNLLPLYETSVHSLLDRKKGEIVDLEYFVTKMTTPVASPLIDRRAHPSMGEVGNAVAAILTENQVLVPITEVCLNRLKRSFNKYEEMTASALKWLDLLVAFMQIPGYSQRFFEKKESLKFLFLIMEGKSLEEHKKTFESTGDLFWDLFSTFIELCEKAGPDTTSQIWKECIKTKLFDRLLIMASDLSGIEPARSEFFTKDSFYWKEVQDKERKEKLKEKKFGQQRRQQRILGQRNWIWHLQ
eukprot:TRINITY_DN251_c1_g1_i2.p1 TRINITY_DN251_c1_g1~~TRINITY_DN251_c1_g1_i2.p1  ORF type:complete len:2611 (+),score=770.84 TRINITY_DN251_c1_g1_i2:114-7835(+)